MFRKLFSILMVSALVLLQVGPALAAAGGPVPVGQVLGSGLYLNGLAVPSGTTVMSGAELSTRNQVGTVRLQNGEAIRLNENSAAVVEPGETGTMQVAVSSGSVSYRASGAAALAGANSVVTLGEQIQTGQAVSGSESGVVAYLAQSAASQTVTITVDDSSKIRSGRDALLKSPDGSLQEIHGISSINGNVVTLNAGLGVSFPVQTMVIQDDDVIAAAAAAGTATVVGGVIGAGIGTSGTVLGIGGVVGIVAGTAAGAGVIGMAATSGGDERPASPITP